MRAICRRIWVCVAWAFVAVASDPSPSVIDRLIRIQPIQVCSDDGMFCANSNRILFEAETLKIWAQAGITTEFLPWRRFYGTEWLDLSTSLFADYTIYSLANTPGHEQHSDPTVLNLYFVRSFSNGAFGHS